MVGLRSNCGEERVDRASISECACGFSVYTGWRYNSHSFLWPSPWAMSVLDFTDDGQSMRNTCEMHAKCSQVGVFYCYEAPDVHKRRCNFGPG